MFFQVGMFFKLECFMFQVFMIFQVFMFYTELGTRQLFSFATTTTRQRNRASRTSQGPEKIRKIVRPQCLDGVATKSIVKWQFQTTLCPENMVTLSRQNCRMPSSGFICQICMLSLNVFKV